MEKLHTDKIIVVEGKYDAIKLENIIDATIVCTDGFGIFKNKEKLELLRKLAEKRGLIILTDSDSAGFMIRNYLGGSIPKDRITNVYIPDLFGKERRKDKPSAEGKLGVEGVPTDVLIKALKGAGVGEDASPKGEERRQILRMDLYEDGFIGGGGSKEKRVRLLRALGLPERLSVTGLLSIINILITYEEYRILKDMPDSVLLALNTLKASGFEAFVVGGCVRDSLMGLTPHDWDITTSAKPEQTLEVFSSFKTIPTGLKHGTVTVLIDDESLEITTFRIDGEYEDGRHPDSVVFTSNLEEDLSRRDFTINAMAYSPSVGFVDCFGGMEDIENRTIKCVGEPDKRFGEDALRIMRAIRFSSTLGYEISKDTKESILKNRDLLSNVSAERISVELLKLLCGDNATEVLIEFRDVIAKIIPELVPCFDFDQKNKHHMYTIYDHIAHAVGQSPNIPEVRMALLLHDIGKPSCFTVDENGVGHFYGHGKVSEEISVPILKRLRFSAAFQETVRVLVLNHDMDISPVKKIVRRRLMSLGEENLRLLMAVQLGDAMVHVCNDCNPHEEIRDILEILDEIVEEGQAFTISQLEISGNDLIALGMEKGPRIGKILSELLSLVVDDLLENEHEKLLQKAQEIISLEEK